MPSIFLLHGASDSYSQFLSIAFATIALLISNSVEIQSLKFDQTMSGERITEVQHTIANLNSRLNELKNIVVYQNTSNCGPGLWQRVAYLNMGDPLHQCPPIWQQYSANGVRACGRPIDATFLSCFSVNFSSTTPYSRVCGQVIGYQVGSTDLFNGVQDPIDTAYVDGVSITYGTPRTHVWTYAASISDTLVPGEERASCPCVLDGTLFTPDAPPNFVGHNYYCESGNPSNTTPTGSSRYTLELTDDPLWDGQNCEGQCCSDGRNPPWFSVQLTDVTTSDIEVRICGSETTYSENTPISMLEIYTGH